jgi:hypothetical protein
MPRAAALRQSSAKKLEKPQSSGAMALQEAREFGLLDGEKTEHISFRAPKALLEAARQESGAATLTELGLMALAMLAQPDPFKKFMKENYGALGPDHKLDI